MELAERAEARVVDEPVDREAPVLDLPHEIARRARLDEVARDHVHAHVVALLELARERLQPVSPSGDEHEMTAVASDAAGEGRADAARGPGNERDVQRHGRPSLVVVEGPG